MIGTEESAKAEGKPAPQRRRRARQRAPSPRLTGIYASLLASYLRLVNATSRLTYDPADFPDRASRMTPFIITMWHGQSFMMPFARPREVPVDILVSRHGDGELMARTLKKLGCGTVRGSGARRLTRSLEKGGASAFMAMRSRLQGGVSIGLTADFDNKAPRQVGLGVILLAQATGRPIIPAAFATSRRIELKTWDRTTINLPFSRAACAFGDFIYVPASADDAVLEEKRRQLEDAINAATARAHEIVDRRHG